MSICHQYQNPLEFLSSAAIEFEEQEMLCKYLLESKNKEEEQSKKKTSKKGVCLDYIERKGKRRIKWTPSLHNRFVEAIKYLGKDNGKYIFLNSAKKKKNKCLNKNIFF
eukprot:TRINITY_DN814_c1_g1_i7.p1 TRINITY_DN814_c1_g1~~TRINITY_DN814_c1_g1_i7.p1  ORF type:complete len:109 (-),score=23.16 TRINITY_DN814_c1_g1_i7:803-1129(-)